MKEVALWRGGGGDVALWLRFNRQSDNYSPGDIIEIDGERERERERERYREIQRDIQRERKRDSQRGG